jgi:hypothetical protein
LILVVAAKVDEQSHIPAIKQILSPAAAVENVMVSALPLVLAAHRRRAMQRMTPKSNLLSS